MKFETTLELVGGKSITFDAIYPSKEEAREAAVQAFKGGIDHAVNVYQSDGQEVVVVPARNILYIKVTEYNK